MVSSLTTYFPGVKSVISPFNRIVFYSSGIFWSVEKVLAGFPLFLEIALLNPVYQFVLLFRGVVLGFAVEPGVIMVRSIGTGLCTAIVGIFLFRSAMKSSRA